MPTILTPVWSPFTVTEADIITDALETIGVLGVGEVLQPEDQILARRKLNFIVQQWSVKSDFSQGVKRWARKRGYLFLQKDQSVYELGTTGDQVAADEYTATTLSVGASGGASSVTVTDVSGIGSGFRIGVLLDSGTIAWSTVSGIAGSVVSFSGTLPSAAASGKRVFAYANRIARPTHVLTAQLVDSDSRESPIDVSMSVYDYEAISDKTLESSVSRAYFEANLTNAKIYFDCQPDDVTKVVRFVYLAEIDAFDSATDTVDFAPEWLRPLSAQLAMDLCLPFQIKTPPELKGVRDESLAIAQRAYPENEILYFEPFADGHA